ncbi:hypothetical protein [Dolichospermum heterosporum]|uniref:Uncharacterized protein n=1 Tax=Dolichospermum heterosporum TAC447 TaxID=747523 RepID=A0ABY5LU93_9CYAN|nr:hypothetical protein [Dolichospermum heterosporum]UUO15532.1 hypothetical protein NG743_00230 [Dolichospermum heterosporum TAC447]
MTKATLRYQEDSEEVIKYQVWKTALYSCFHFISQVLKGWRFITPTTNIFLSNTFLLVAI